MHIYTHMYIYIYIYTYIRTHIYTFINIVYLLPFPLSTALFLITLLCLPSSRYAQKHVLLTHTKAHQNTNKQTQAHVYTLYSSLV